jgi:hypothetical protein
VSTISSSDLAALASHGAIAVPVDTTDSAVMKNVHLSAQDAMSNVMHALSFMNTASVKSVTLARFTDDQYGIPGDAEPSTTGKPKTTGSFTPLIKDRLVWLAILTDVPMFLSGPRLSDPQPTRSPAVTKESMFVAVDATTGKVLIAATVVHGS